MHSDDNPWRDDLVTIAGTDGPMIQNGYVTVPEAPGLGIELDEVAIKEHLAVVSERREGAPYPYGFFEPTDEWNELDAHDRTWS